MSDKPVNNGGRHAAGEMFDAGAVDMPAPRGPQGRVHGSLGPTSMAEMPVAKPAQTPQNPGSTPTKGLGVSDMVALPVQPPKQDT